MFIPGNLSAKSKIRTSFTQSIQRHRRTAETFSKIQILGLDSPDKKQHNTQKGEATYTQDSDGSAWSPSEQLHRKGTGS